jgi:hypothetical protein
MRSKNGLFGKQRVFAQRGALSAHRHFATRKTDVPSESLVC